MQVCPALAGIRDCYVARGLRVALEGNLSVEMEGVQCNKDYHLLCLKNWTHTQRERETQTQTTNTRVVAICP